MRYRLTARSVETTKAAGLYGDGGGLYLQVGVGGARSWIFRFQMGGRRRDMGLGSVDVITLAMARDKALAAKRLVVDGIDPIEIKAASRAAARLEEARALTFRMAAERYIESHKSGWKNEKHTDQWTATLSTYAFPAFGDLPIASIDTAIITKALEALWSEKTETASRLRNRIELVLDWATARGYRVGENPARWRGHLDKLLPKPSKVRTKKHHPALPYSVVGEFMAKLRAISGLPARALEFTILTTGRTAQTLGARWDEFDLDAATWTVPGERMKAGREHRVPLAPDTVKLLRKVAALELVGEFVFPGRREGTPLSDKIMVALLRRMGYSANQCDVHGFRSTFTDWAHEKTSFPGEAVEMALAHTVSDKVEAAYRRGDLFEKRRALAEAWAGYCGSGSPAKVVPMRRAKA